MAAGRTELVSRAAEGRPSEDDSGTQVMGNNLGFPITGPNFFFSDGFGEVEDGPTHLGQTGSRSPRSDSPCLSKIKTAHTKRTTPTTQLNGPITHATSLVAKTVQNLSKKWLLDCGATDTMSYDLSDFKTTTKPTKTHIQTANGGCSKVEGAGRIDISPSLKLTNCLYVPSLSSKLLSISHVTKELNCTVLMHPSFCLLQDILTRRIIGRGTEHEGLYYVDEVNQQGSAMLAHGTVNRQIWLWHRRLGHPSSQYLKKLFPNFFAHVHHLSCETCVLAKSHRKVFHSNNTRTNTPFSLVHSDVWGPSPENSNGFSYFLLFVDDCTRMTWVFFLKKNLKYLKNLCHFIILSKPNFENRFKYFGQIMGGNL